MITYSQSSGAVTGSVTGTGYSGHGEGLNNPAMEADPDVGPIPRGKWRIGQWHDHPRLGPCVAPLTPIGHDAHGRTEFFIHGDNSEGNHSASHGCIILGPAIRHAMRDSGDSDLQVV